MLLQDWVTIQAETRPHAPAVVGKDDDRLTYGELHSRSNQLARLLIDAGCRRGDRVSVMMPKTPMALVAILGIYKADCIFVPLDPASPPMRLARVLASCDCRCMLAAGPVAELVQQLIDRSALPPSTPIGWLGPMVVAGQRFAPWFAQNDLRSYASTAPPCRNTDRDPAHLLFTSGSTGAPKGVVITHANVIQFVEWARRYFGMSTSDRISGHSPLHFDLSTFDIFGTFAAGAELHLVPPELNVLPHRLAEFIRVRELTQWFSVPSILNYLSKFDVIDRGDFPTLKRLMWCGEVLPTPALMHWMEQLPHVTFTNLYGPTEATIASAYHTLKVRPRDQAAEVPIGPGKLYLASPYVVAASAIAGKIIEPDEFLA
jgi:non-ribosomal peptide synthetase component F